MKTFVNREFKITVSRAGDRSDELFTFVCNDRGGYQAQLEITESTDGYRKAAELTIYGLSKEKLQDLSFLQFDCLQYPLERRRYMKVFHEGMVIFSGDMVLSVADYSNMPNIALRAEAVVAYLDEKKAAAQHSFDDGVVELNQAFSVLVGDMGAGWTYASNKKFNGVKVKKIILDGTIGEQIKRLADEHGVKTAKNDINKTITIRTEPPTDEGVDFEISVENGMIGYPTISSRGVEVQTLFNPKITIGRYITIKSDLPFASGKWMVNTIKHSLSTIAGGTWATQVSAVLFRMGGQ
jgi:hypothetical protein